MSLTAFFKENVVDPYEEVEFVVSDRFKDENGNPIHWRLRPMSPDKTLQTSDDATIINGKEADFKTSIYFMKVVTNTVVYPNLNDAELQDSYGVMTPEKLIDKMLNTDEFNRLLKKCQQINGIDKTFDAMKEEVKN